MGPLRPPRPLPLWLFLSTPNQMARLPWSQPLALCETTINIIKGNNVLHVLY